MLFLINTGAMIDERSSTYIWRDEAHKVREGAAGSLYAGRFVVLGKRSNARRSVVLRHFSTPEEAIRWCESDGRTRKRAAGDGGDGQELAVPVSAQPVPAVKARPRGRPRKSRLIEQDGEMLRVFLPKQRPHVVPTHIRFPWVTTRFTCIRANPIAQVWMCVKHENEVRQGRRRSDGTNEQTKLPHRKGQFAVTTVEVFNNTCRAEPVRNADGSVKAYDSIRLADFAAEDLYLNADEESQMTWAEGDKSVFRTLNVEVLFDPVNNRPDRPFSLWLPYYNKPIFENKTKVTVQFDRSPDQLRAAGMSEQMLMEVEAYRQQQRQLSRAPAFSEYALTFPSMEGAITAALKIERDIFKGRFLGFAGQGVGT